MRSNPSAFVAALRAAQTAHPSMRTCQILVNALGIDPFYVEDGEAVAKLYAYAQKGVKP